MVKQFQSIPPMVGDLGRSWHQPDSKNFLIDDAFAGMGVGDFDELHEYSASYPSGVYEGKMWRRHEGAFLLGSPPDQRRWLLAWFGPSEHPDKCSINMREISLFQGSTVNGGSVGISGPSKPTVEFEPFAVALDLNLLKVGDPMIQAAMGGSHRLLDQLPTTAWLSYATPELALYRVDDQGKLDLILMVLRARAGKW